MRFLISLGTEQKEFFVSLAKLIAKEYEISILAVDDDVARFAREHLPDTDIAIRDLGGNKEAKQDLVEHALSIEKKYSIRLAMLLSQDRALGRGYLFNVDKYPMIEKAKWPHERKLSTVVSRIENYESLIDRFKPDCIISWRNNPIQMVVSAYHNILSLELAPVKLGERFIWSENCYLTSSKFLSLIKEYSRELPGKSSTSQGGYQDVFSRARVTQTYGVAQAITEAIYQVAIEFYRLVRGSRKSYSYTFLGWVPVILRRPVIYRRLQRRGVKPVDLESRKVCFFPLHLEPELTLLSISPEFSNSVELITWVSKSLPADFILVLKENPISFGVRSKWYYSQLEQISNVQFAHPVISSLDWIHASELVVTITGTAGSESVLYKRPVLSFGSHQAINELPTVRFANNYVSTLHGINELLALKADDSRLEHSRQALNLAQINSSFNLPGFAEKKKTVQSEKDSARTALDALRRDFQIG
jgi:hypothetical protein